MRSATFVVRWWAKRHEYTEACDGKDLLDCYESVEHELRSRKVESARIEASVFAAREGLDLGDARLVRPLTTLELLSGDDEWSENVEPPEHLTSCYVANGGASVRDHQPFWVCSKRCPVVRSKK